MPGKKRELTNQPTNRVIAKLFSPGAVAKMKAIAHEKDSIFLKLSAQKVDDKMTSDSDDEDSMQL